jgi:hypothetical protein
MGKLLIVISSFLLATVVMSTQAQPKEKVRYAGCSVTGAVEDNLMSDDMAEYIVKFGKGRDFAESDLE